MGLDITFKTRMDVLCPHCGEVLHTTDAHVVESGGRWWYPILEDIGYYVPFEKRTEENDWYGKDMVLTSKQIDEVYTFVRLHPHEYNADEILGLLALAKVEGDSVVINADW